MGKVSSRLTWVMGRLGQMEYSDCVSAYGTESERNGNGRRVGFGMNGEDVRIVLGKCQCCGDGD